MAMKLYATTTSEREGRPAKKGADERLVIELSYKNQYIGEVQLRNVAANGWVLEVWRNSALAYRDESDNLKGAT